MTFIIIIKKKHNFHCHLISSKNNLKAYQAPFGLVSWRTFSTMWNYTLAIQ